MYELVFCVTGCSKL